VHSRTFQPGLIPLRAGSTVHLVADLSAGTLDVLATDGVRVVLLSLAARISLNVTRVTRS